MAEPSQVANASIPKPSVPAPVPRFKYRLRFRKSGDLRLVSHHDLMHVFERMLRRAAIPVAHSQGFHPQPRMVFALSLALGVAGANEVLELDLTQPLDPEYLHTRLASQAPPGLEILNTRRLEGKSSSLVRRAFYSLPLASENQTGTYASGPGGSTLPPDDLPDRCQNLLAQTVLLVQRSRPQPRSLDIRPYLNDIAVRDGNLELAVWVTPTGTARPEEFARLLGLESLLQAGAFFQRTGLEMMDEIPAHLPEIIINPKEIPTQERIS